MSKSKRDQSDSTASAEIRIPLEIVIRIGLPAPTETTPPTTASTPTVVVQSPTPQPEVDLLEGRFGGGQDSGLDRSDFSLGSFANAGFSWDTALSTALASELAYADASTVKTTVEQQWRFDQCEFFDIERTQGFFATTDEVVLVAYRGTQQLHDWLTNLNLRSRRIGDLGKIHSGFYAAFEVTQSHLESKIGELDDRALVITGHSLGGAIATVAAAVWDDTYEVTSVYTYGQPAVGKIRFRSRMRESYGDSFFRFVNDDDIVTRVPPGYRHVGNLRHFDRNGDLHGQLESAGGNQQPMMGEAEFQTFQQDLTANHELEGLIPSFRDHSMLRYIEKIRQQLS